MAKSNLIKKFVSPMVVLNILALLIFCLLLWFGSQLWMNYYTHHGEGIEVPEVVGMKVVDAERELEELHLQAQIVDSVYDKHRPVGTILDQKPAALSKVKSGRQIYLTVNKSAMDKQPLPSIIGNCTQQQAKEILRKNGFIVGNTEFTYGDKDMVLGVKSEGFSVHNGQYIAPDKPLTIVVGQNMMESDEYSRDYEVINGEDEYGGWEDEELIF